VQRDDEVKSYDIVGLRANFRAESRKPYLLSSQDGQFQYGESIFTTDKSERVSRSSYDDGIEILLWDSDSDVKEAAQASVLGHMLNW
jgi:hypothetical protein